MEQPKFRKGRIWAVVLLLVLGSVSVFSPGVLEPLRRVAATPGIFLKNGGGDTNAALRSESARLRELTEENAALKRTLAVSGSIARPRVMARVLWEDPDPAHHRIRIALDEGHRVSQGDAVAAPGDILIGKVDTVGKRSASVLLLDDPAFKVSVSIGETIALGKGDGRGGLILEFVERENFPAHTILVRTAGKEGAIPKGLLVGALMPEDEGVQAEDNPLRVISPVVSAPLDTVFVLHAGIE